MAHPSLEREFSYLLELNADEISDEQLASAFTSPWVAELALQNSRSGAAAGDDARARTQRKQRAERFVRDWAPSRRSFHDSYVLGVNFEQRSLRPTRNINYSNLDNVVLSSSSSSNAETATDLGGAGAGAGGAKKGGASADSLLRRSL